VAPGGKGLRLVEAETRGLRPRQAGPATPSQTPGGIAIRVYNTLFILIYFIYLIWLTTPSLGYGWRALKGVHAYKSCSSEDGDND
jgi:hypothetical protein